jgi:hypothetical protein
MGMVNYSNFTFWVGKGLANHLQVPLPYLLYRAQARYEEDLRGLQGIQTTLNATALSPTNQAGSSHGPSSSASTPAQQVASPSGEYFPRISAAEKPGMSHKDSVKFPGGVFSSTARPLAIRTRLNSLTARSLNSPLRATTSSVITLQGIKRPHQQLPHHPHLLSSSRVSRVSSDADSSEEDEELRKLEEEEKKAEEQAALDRKLKELTLKLTKDQLGLVLSPQKDKGKRREVDRGRIRPMSVSSTASLHQQLHMSRRHSLSQTPSHHSLSSTTGSPQDSIPSIPSPPSEARSQPHSPSPMRHISPAGKSTSPPTVAYNNAWAIRNPPAGRPRAAGRVRSDIGSEMGSTASSLSDFSGT